MDVDEMLGIVSDDAGQRHALMLVESDQRLLDSLIRLRDKHGLSQEEVGKRMNVSQSAVARIESGERDPRLSTLRRYAMALGALITHEVRPIAEGPVRTRDKVWSSSVAAEWDSQPILVPAGHHRRG